MSHVIYRGAEISPFFMLGNNYEKKIIKNIVAFSFERGIKNEKYYEIYVWVLCWVLRSIHPRWLFKMHARKKFAINLLKK